MDTRNWLEAEDLTRRLPTTAARSAAMSRIRSRNTRPEYLVRRALWNSGVRFRLHNPRIPGRPDITHTGAKVAVFIDGCFWHGCPRHYISPKSNASYWRNKIAYNRRRRKRVLTELRELGFRVVAMWECEVERDATAAARKIARLIRRYT